MKTTYITIATVSTYVPEYNAHEETQVWFRRRRGYLTVRGIQRLLKAGCDETHGETWSGTVTRIERAVSA
jgi:hypothetical protein